MNGLFILENGSFEQIYPQPIRDEIGRLVDLVAPQQTSASIRQNLALLNEVDVVFSGWGAPRLDEEFLDAAPRMQAFLYGAGSVRSFVTDAFWERDILLSSAVAANAIPVAEFTLSQILFCLKSGWQHNRHCKSPESVRFGGFSNTRTIPTTGAFQSTVGLVSLGQVARKVIELLTMFDLRIIAYDPFVSNEEARRLGIELCSLEGVFERADVVSIHTPDLPETRGMITGDLVSRMGTGKSLINTSRSAIIRHAELIRVLEERTDLWAVLDVTELATDEQYQKLKQLSNVTLTPHIAGSMGAECARMGQYMLDELRRLRNGEDLVYAISRKQAAIMA